MRQAAANRAAVFAEMIFRYCSSSVSIRRCVVSCSTSPSAITAEAWLRIFSTRRDPSSTISSKARLNRKSPTRTVAGLPQMRLAVRLPRRRPGAVDHIVVEQGRGVDELDAAASFWWRVPL